MQRSLLVLSDAPDYAARLQRLAHAQERFQRLVVPQLETAFTSHNQELAKECVQMLKDVDREVAVMESYVRCHSNQAGDAFSLHFARFPHLFDLLVHSGRSRYRPWGDVAATHHRSVGGWRRSYERNLTILR